jgi:hypothetical protein
VAEAVAVVAGLDDVAMVGEQVQHRRGHLGIPEDALTLAQELSRTVIKRGSNLDANYPGKWIRFRCKSTIRGSRAGGDRCKSFVCSYHNEGCTEEGQLSEVVCVRLH